MSTFNDPLRKTAPDLQHRFWVTVYSTNQWYAVMREAREWFGKNWTGQRKVKRKISNRITAKTGLPVWFDVPDPRWATWIATKLAVQVTVMPPKVLDK